MTMPKSEMTILSCGQHDTPSLGSEGVTIPTPGIECRHHWLHHDEDNTARGTRSGDGATGSRVVFLVSWPLSRPPATLLVFDQLHSLPHRKSTIAQGSIGVGARLKLPVSRNDLCDIVLGLTRNALARSNTFHTHIRRAHALYWSE